MFLKNYKLMWFNFYRFRQRSIERAMDLTDSFTWEDLPTRDADTGQLTEAGWIPLILMYNSRIIVGMYVYHCVHSTIRIVKSHETIFITWYPFDWTVPPFYELVNISQVTISQCKSNKITIEIFIYFSYLNRRAYPIWQFLYCFATMLLIRIWKKVSIYFFPTNCSLIQGIWFEGQKDTKNIPDTTGFRTDICRIQVHSATAVQTGGFNRSFICWYRVQEPLNLVTQTDVTKIFHVLNQDTAEH